MDDEQANGDGTRLPQSHRAGLILDAHLSRKISERDALMGKSRPNLWQVPRVDLSTSLPTMIAPSATGI